MRGNSYLSREEQNCLQKFYPVMMKPERYPCDCTAAIYSSRGAYPIEKILGSKNSVVFDAGCGYGSESFLFASLGARECSRSMALPNRSRLPGNASDI